MTHSGEPSNSPKMSEVNGGGRDHEPHNYKVVKGVAPIHNRSLCFVDIEHFGWPNKHRTHQPVVDVACIKVKPNGEIEHYESKLAVTDLDIEWANEKAIDVIGFDRDEWSDAPPRNEVLGQLWAMVAGHAWVGHNASGDITRIVDEFGIAGIPMPRMWTCPVYDTAHLARLLIPGLGGYKLEDLCRHFGIEQEQEHRAMGGAQRCKEVFDSLMSGTKSQARKENW